jgi:hypothetical protein
MQINQQHTLGAQGQINHLYHANESVSRATALYSTVFAFVDDVSSVMFESSVDNGRLVE